MPEWTEHLRPRLASLRLNPTREAEIIEELSQHLDQRYDELRSGGADEAEACRLAIDELREPELLAQHMQTLRQARVAPPIVPGAHNGPGFLGNLWQDVRYGWRGLVRQPAFSAVAVITLALGIGAAAAIFSAIQNVLLDPAPYADLDRLVLLIVRDATRDTYDGRNAFQVPEILEFQRQSQSFEEITAGRRDDLLLSTAEGTEVYRGAIVTPNTFRFLGVPPLLGRPLVDADARPGASPVFVMSHKMWIARFNGDPEVVGRTFTLDGVPTICVGVMPQRFTKNGGDLWRPIALEYPDAKWSRDFFFFQGKLKPGVTLEQAAAEMDVIAHRVAKAYPDNYPAAFRVSVVRWVDGQVREFRATLYVLFAAVALLLLIACSNVANMLLARGAARARELAIRTSLGASRWLVIRQLLVESLILAFGGAILGCLCAYAAIKGIAGLIPLGLLPGEVQIRMNFPVLFFALVIGVFTALIFGLVPALQTVHRNVADPLKDTGRGVIGGFRRGRLRNALVVAEVALSLVLLSGAGLLMRSFVKLQSTDLGLNPENVLFARLPLPRDQYKTAEKKQQFFGEVLRRLQRVPGVVAAAATATLPPYGGFRTDIDIPGKTHVEPWETMGNLASEEYFQVVGLQLLRGRTFSPAEVGGARKVAVVNETLAKRYFGGEHAVGQHIRLKRLETLPDGYAVPNAMFEIIGVVSDAKNRGVVAPPLPEVIVPYTITGAFEGGMLVRTQGAPEALINSLRHEVWAVDRGVAVTDIGTLNSFLTQYTYAEPRFSLVLLGAFASVGLLLVAVGVYSVIAYTVSRQTREIGIRMTLGASQGEVLRMVGAMGLRLIAIGAAIGLLASFGATKVIASQLTGISPHDPLTLVGVVALMVFTGIAASYFPARRAANVDPLVALRMD